MKKIRLANKEDISQIMMCINDAKELLKNSGSSQWQGANGYPNEIDIEEDIANQCLYVCTENGDIAGVVALLGEEEEYKEPYGKWLVDTTRYLTIHRLSVRSEFRGKGIAKTLFQFAENYTKEHDLLSIRVDTHEKNIIMQNLVQRMGYHFCGYVIYQRIDCEPKRLIYEKLIKK